MSRTTIPRSIGAALLAVWIAFAPALAGAGGTLDFAPDAEWATPVSDAELAEQRGGYGIYSFSVYYEGRIAADMTGAGVFYLGQPDSPLQSEVPDPAATSGQVDLVNFVGSMGPFTGIGQWAIVNGDGNEVVNNLTVNIFVMDQVGQLSSFFDVLGTNGPAR